MKVAYSKVRKQAAINHIKSINPWVKDPEDTFNRLLRSLTEGDCEWISSGGFTLVSHKSKDTIHVEILVIPCIGGWEDEVLEVNDEV